MGIAINPDEVLATMQRDFPREYEICCLRVVTETQARRIAQLEQAQTNDKASEE